ncbi:hypothetical protein [Wolbachia endosymbiont of Cimex lectularius]|uniref:hypothetical protein n=1 Tax=Wolbachia endosymbiont of Cimex lectularius TaxID=246273 RepID=UPI00049A9845|nr:hypothetical protein [Wolbachia endosymbiont of Cimex lectularius]BAP00367.1 hypothetical protein WCLE_010820 [Wolbachia endosymbiont of Cimex lectularius]
MPHEITKPDVAIGSQPIHLSTLQDENVGMVEVSKEEGDNIENSYRMNDTLVGKQPYTTTFPFSQSLTNPPIQRPNSVFGSPQTAPGTGNSVLLPRPSSDLRENVPSLLSQERDDDESTISSEDDDDKRSEASLSDDDEDNEDGLVLKIMYNYICVILSHYLIFLSQKTR